MAGLAFARPATALAMAALLGGCGVSPTASGSPSPPRPSPAAPTPSPTLSPSPSASASRSPTPTATPTPTPPPPSTLQVAAGIQVPSGFHAYIYSSGLVGITAMAYGPDGQLYATGQSGTIWSVAGPGRRPVVASGGWPTALGLAWRGTDLFVSVRGSVRIFHLAGSSLSGGGAVVDGLPWGRHQNDNLLLLPDGDFLLGVGSTCDVCIEGNSRSATVLRFHSDWTLAGIVVRGARNPYGLAWRSSVQQAYVTINGQDNLGAQPGDEVIPVVDGSDAGWPRCWPSYPDGGLHGSCAGVTAPAAVFAPHTSADGIVFYEATEFPAAYRDNAFVAEWGANAGGPTGRRVERVVFSGPPGAVTDFATGFDHPLAVAIAPDGGLLVGDWGTGHIVEIVYTG